MYINSHTNNFLYISLYIHIPLMLCDGISVRFAVCKTDADLEEAQRRLQVLN